MTDPSMSDTALIDRLVDLGEQLDGELAGAGDGLADSVLAMLDAEPVARAGHRRFTRGARLVALAAAVVLLVAVLVAIPGSRRTIARWFGVGSVRIEPVATLPVTSAPADADADQLGLGPPVGPEAAVAATGLPLPVVPSLGEPESFHLPGGPQIVARYDVEGRSVLVAVLAGMTDQTMFGKQASPGQVSAVDVPGSDGGSTRGVWIEGEPHTFGYLDADGKPGVEPLRLAGDTLLWERAGVTLRVEGARDLAEALEIAGSMEL